MEFTFVRWSTVTLFIPLIQAVFASLPAQTHYACYNQVLDLKCPHDEVLVFESARYGRNDTELASDCRTPFQRNCDIDAHFPINRLCSGKMTCALVVSTEMFGDPCGYEEFLKVVYTCVQVSSLQSQCSTPEAPALFDHGHIASPNYPEKYYMDAECTWTLRVQSRQTLSITLFDFELDVKRGGTCYDFLEIRTAQHIYFHDCGAMGKQRVLVDANTATVRFKAAQSGLTQRGFLIYFEAVGPGCPDIDLAGNGSVSYTLDGGDLTAEILCAPGHSFPGSDILYRPLYCQGALWNDTVEPCLAAPLSVTWEPSTTPLQASQAGGLARSSTIVGVALGVVSSLLLIALLLVLALYLQRRRQRAEQKLDEMRVVFNNLQENAFNDGNLQGMYCKGPSTNLRRPDRRKRHNQPENCNLLTSPPYLDESDYDGEKECNTLVKCLPEDAYGYGRCGKGRCSRDRSRDDSLDQSQESDDQPPVPPRRSRHQHQRARSGVWDSPGRMAIPERRSNVPQQAGLLTQSAPDLLALLNVHQQQYALNSTLPAQVSQSRRPMSRSSTLANFNGHRTVQKMRSRSSSRANVRT